MSQDIAPESNPRAASTRIGSATAKTLSGQIRHDLRRGPQPAYVDAARLDLNRVLIEPLPPGQMRAICEERRALRDTQRGMKSNAAVATRGLITLGSEAAQLFERLTPDQQHEAFRDLAQAIASRLNTSLHGLVVHRDEATLHAHYQLAAYDLAGHPLAKSTSPRVLSELQDLTAEVLARHCPGIERGRRYGDRIAAGADYSETVHRSVAELHRTLPVDLAAKRAKVAELAEAERLAAQRVEEMQERVRKLEEKASLSEKELKRLATYQARLSDRVAELQSAAAATEAGRAEEERLAELARVDRQAEEERLDRIAAKASAVGAAVAALVQEVQDETIRRTPEGRIRAKAPERLKPGYPEVAPAVAVAADFVTGMVAARGELQAARGEVDQARQKVAEDRRDLDAGFLELDQGQVALATERREVRRERKAVAALRQRLDDLVARLARWLRRPDLGAEARQEAVPLVHAVRALRRDEAQLVQEAEEVRPDF